MIINSAVLPTQSPFPTCQALLASLCSPEYLIVNPSDGSIQNGSFQTGLCIWFPFQLQCWEWIPWMWPAEQTQGLRQVPSRKRDRGKLRRSEMNRLSFCQEILVLTAFCFRVIAFGSFVLAEGFPPILCQCVPFFDPEKSEQIDGFSVSSCPRLIQRSAILLEVARQAWAAEGLGISSWPSLSSRLASISLEFFSVNPPHIGQIQAPIEPKQPSGQVESGLDQHSTQSYQWFPLFIQRKSFHGRSRRAREFPYILGEPKDRTYRSPYQYKNTPRRISKVFPYPSLYFLQFQSEFLNYTLPEFHCFHADNSILHSCPYSVYGQCWLSIPSPGMLLFFTILRIIVSFCHQKLL